MSDYAPVTQWSEDQWRACRDTEYRGVTLRVRCKHTLACELQNGNEALLIAYGESLMQEQEP